MSSLSITIVQSSLYWENKPANLSMFSERLDEIKEKTEIIILPEMFSTGFSMKTEALAETMEGETVAWMKKTAAKKNAIITGSIIIQENGKYFNRLVWMLPNGERGYYDKRHLFAFADEDKLYSPGHKRLIASVKGWKINLLICYDLRFPVWARQSHDPGGQKPGTESVPEFDLLIYIANWPERRIHAWKTLLQARAIENQCYVAGVNRVGDDGNDIHYSGDSMIVDPLGEIVYQKSQEEDLFTLTLEKEKLVETRNKFPFLRDADNFLIEP